MMQKIGRPLLLWLLAMLVGLAIAWQSRFSADMSFFLPAHPSPAQQVLVDQIKEGVVSRLLMLAITADTPEQRAVLSRDLRARLSKLPEFVAVQNGEAGSQDLDRNFLIEHRYLLSPAVSPEHFSVAGLQTAIGDSIDRLASPAGMMLKPLLTRDPTGEMVALLSHLDSGAQPNSNHGVWASHDGERAMLLLQTRALGSDTDAQEATIKLVEAQFAASVEAQKITSARLQLSGPGLFAVHSRATIKDEITRLSLISTGTIIAVLFFVYRSLRLLSLGLLPVVSGALAGVVAVSLAYGTVFGITIGFGSALIGEAVDYSIYYFVQSSRLGVEQWRRRFWPTIRLGVLTSIGGFGALLFSGFPGLAQLGLYSLAGVLTAALVTRFVLPQLAGDTVPMRDLSRLGGQLRSSINALQHLRWPVLALALTAIVHLAIQRDNLWHPDLSALSSVSEADSALDMAMRADIGTPDARYMVVINAADREAALQAAERAALSLDPLIDQGIIGGYDSPARFLPSQATQAMRRASLPSSEDLQARLKIALADSPLAAGKLTAFVKDVEATRLHGEISRASLNGTGLALVVDSLLQQGPNGWSVLLPLRPPADEPDLRIPVDAVRAALNGSDALFIDMKGEFDKLYNDYLQEAILLSLAGLLAIVGLLAVTLRSARQLGAVMLPLGIAVLMVIATLNLLGERLHLLHLIGMLLIVAVGSNYALFFNCSGDNRELDAQTLVSMLIANLTTAIGFGTLALSKVPVLHAVGITVGPGAVLALLLSAIFVSRGTTK